jgi:hypothetical protein
MINEGTIDDGNLWLDLEVGGDLHNAGHWNNHITTLIGGGHRQMSDTSVDGFVCEFQVASGTEGSLTAITPLTIQGAVDLGDQELVLEPGSHLTLKGSIFKARVMAQGNQVRFESWSYLVQCTIDDAVLVGEARVASAVFTTRVTVKNSLKNTTATGGGSAVIQGDLVNYGLIQNENYSFFFQVHGDVENHGTLDVPNLEFMGAGVTHRLYMGPDAQLLSNVFMPEFQPSTLISESPVTFGGGLGLGYGELILEPGASLHFSQHSGVGSGTVLANGNTITTETGNSGLASVVIVEGVIGAYAAIHGDVLFIQGLTVQGHLSGWPWAEARAEVKGLLRNEGQISDGDHPVRVTARDDVLNLGTMTFAQLIMSGYLDQKLAVGEAFHVSEVVLESNIYGPSYQWYRDGVALEGETESSLVLGPVGAMDLGHYHCETPELVSRDIFITESPGTSHVPAAALADLQQNHPNPFNPSTVIAFQIQEPGPVSLKVYDLAGREVATLVDREMSAGNHQFNWEPRGLASGTYFYRLRASGTELIKKCSLLK